jgi:hypothetical protein
VLPPGLRADRKTGRARNATTRTSGDTHAREVGQSNLCAVVGLSSLRELLYFWRPRRAIQSCVLDTPKPMAAPSQIK